eukprot:1821099-Pyramimonas_sp.AAC.1
MRSPSPKPPTGGWPMPSVTGRAPAPASLCRRMDQGGADVFADLDDEPYAHDGYMDEPSAWRPTSATGAASSQRPGLAGTRRPQRRTPEERRRQRTEGKQAPIQFANITEYGPQAAKFLAERGKRKYKAIAFAETHATAEQLTATQVALGKGGWR